MDSNSRSRTWHDKLTNVRGRELEEFLITQQLFIMNEESDMKTFQSSRGSSNIDLTISNYKLLKEVQEWKISEEESCLDHKIIQFCIGQYNAQQTGNNFQSIKYIPKEENLKKFEASVNTKNSRTNVRVQLGRRNYSSRKVHIFTYCYHRRHGRHSQQIQQRFNDGV